MGGGLSAAVAATDNGKINGYKTKQPKGKPILSFRGFGSF